MHEKMSKISVFLVLFVGLTFSSSAISVERKVFPDEIKQGQSVIVTITVKKEGEEGFAKLSNMIPEFENRFNLLKKKMTDNEKDIEKSIEVIQEKSKGLETSSEKIDEFGKKIEASAQSVDDANSQYVDELSKAADILRSKTNNP